MLTSGKHTATAHRTTRALRSLLHLNHENHGAGKLLSFDELMELSGAHLEGLARERDDTTMLIASRILDTPEIFRRWESEHARLMHGIAALTRRRLQVRSLLMATLALLHRKALVEYIRERRLPSPARQRLIGHFHGHDDYVQTLLAEHGKYLRSAASFLCTAHIGHDHVHHGAFGEPLRSYTRLYSEYFRIYCDTAIAEPGSAGRASNQLLLPWLKRELLDARNQLLAHPIKP